MSDAVIDLDVLRVKKKIVKLGGHEIDVSFVPLGITFDLDEIAQKMMKLDQDKIIDGKSVESKKAFDLAVELCACFCGWKHPEMTAEWFNENVDGTQLTALANVIRETLQRAYDGIDLKNAEAAQVDG